MTQIQPAQSMALSCCHNFAEEQFRRIQKVSALFCFEHMEFLNSRRFCRCEKLIETKNLWEKNFIVICLNIIWKDIMKYLFFSFGTSLMSKLKLANAGKFIHIFIRIIFHIIFRIIFHIIFRTVINKVMEIHVHDVAFYFCIYFLHKSCISFKQKSCIAFT